MFKPHETYAYYIMENIIAPTFEIDYRDTNKIEYAQLDENTFIIKKA